MIFSQCITDIFPFEVLRRKNLRLKAHVLKKKLWCWRQQARPVQMTSHTDRNQVDRHSNKSLCLSSFMSKAHKKVFLLIRQKIACTSQLDSSFDSGQACQCTVCEKNPPVSTAPISRASQIAKNASMFMSTSAGCVWDRGSQPSGVRPTVQQEHDLNSSIQRAVRCNTSNGTKSA